MARRKGGDTLKMAAKARAAAMRVEARGYGRPSVSELIVEIVERHIGELED